MVNEIEVTIRGHVGHDPSLVTGTGKQSFLRLNVASTPRVRSREGEWGDGATQWFAVKCFGEFAEHVAHSVRKGDAVLVRGRLEHEEYQTRDGEDRWTAVIVADAFGPDLRMATAHVSRASRRSGPEETEAQPPGDAGEASADATHEATASGATGGTEDAGSAATNGTDAAGAAADAGAVDVSGFIEVPTEEVDAAEEDTMAARMSA